MKKDYHMHPTVFKCTDEEFDLYVKKALSLGIEEIGISDHMPLSCAPASDRIPDGMIELYKERAFRFKEKYKDIISIKLGIEVDYHPSFEREIEAVLKCGGFDYVIGSSHMHVIPDIFSKCDTRNKYAAALLENNLAAVKSGYFDIIAHFDMYKWVFSLPQRFPLTDDGYSDEYHAEIIDDVLSAMKSSGTLLELNAHFAEGTDNLDRMYPSRYITKSALEMGVGFSYGSDAHNADSVGAMLSLIHDDELYSKAIKTFEY